MPQIYVFYQDNVDGANNDSATGSDNAFHYQDWSGSQDISINYTSPKWTKTGYTTYWYLDKAQVYEYKFGGWQFMKIVRRNASGESLPNGTYESGSQITYYTWKSEQWNYFMIKHSIANTYTIRFRNYYNDADVVLSDTTVTYDSRLVLPSIPTRTGYTVTTWFDGHAWRDPGFIYERWQNTSATFTFRADYNANIYTIRFRNFYNDNDVVLQNTTATYDKNFTLPSIPVRTGYTVTKWYDGANWRDPGFTYIPWKNTDATFTFRADYNANSYTITYDTNGGNGGSTVASTPKYDSPFTFATNGFTRTGYDFYRWHLYQGDTFIGEYTSGGSYGTWNRAADHTAKAQWTIKQYTVIFNANGKGTGKDVTQDYNTSVSLPTLKAVGWVFRGWATNSTATTADVTEAFTMPVNGRTLHAVWTENANKTVSFSELKTVYGVTNQTISISEYQKYIQKPANTLTALSGDFKGKGPAPP